MRILCMDHAVRRDRKHSTGYDASTKVVDRDLCPECGKREVTIPLVVVLVGGIIFGTLIAGLIIWGYIHAGMGHVGVGGAV